MFIKRVWQALAFAVSTSVLGILSLIVGLFNGKGARRFARVWGKGLCGIGGVKLKVVGLENLPQDGGGCVVASNHQSAVDIAVVLAGIPADICWVAKESLLKVPFIGWHLKAVHIPVARRTSGNTAKLLAAGAQKIRDGATVVVFPEGTRNHNPEHLLPFRKGAFVLAKAAGRPIIPVGIVGSAPLLRPGSLLPTGGEVTMHIGAAVDPNLFAEDDLEGLAAETRRRIQALLGHPQDEEIPSRVIATAAG